MNRNRRADWLRLAWCSGVVLSVVSLLIAQPQKGPKPSSYAPAKDLRSQVDFFLKRVEIDLSDQTEYGDDQQGRVAKDASTLAVLAWVLGWHDEENDLKRSAPALIAASQKLADESDNYQAATRVLADLKRALAARPAGS